MKEKDVINSWKKTWYKGWKKKSKEKKLEALDLLIYAICLIKHNKLPIIKWGKRYEFNEKEKIIYQNKEKPMILGALHETAHFLYGKSELKACKWSTYLYTKCFKH